MASGRGWPGQGIPAPPPRIVIDETKTEAIGSRKALMVHPSRQAAVAALPQGSTRVPQPNQQPSASVPTAVPQLIPTARPAPSPQPRASIVASFDISKCPPTEAKQTSSSTAWNAYNRENLNVKTTEPITVNQKAPHEWATGRSNFSAKAKFTAPPEPVSLRGYREGTCSAAPAGSAYAPNPATPSRRPSPERPRSPVRSPVGWTQQPPSPSAPASALTWSVPPGIPPPGLKGTPSYTYLQPRPRVESMPTPARSGALDGWGNAPVPPRNDFGAAGVNAPATGLSTLPAQNDGVSTSSRAPATVYYENGSFHVTEASTPQRRLTAEEAAAKVEAMRARTAEINARRRLVDEDAGAATRSGSTSLVTTPTSRPWPEAPPIPSSYPASMFPAPPASTKPQPRGDFAMSSFSAGPSSVTVPAPLAMQTPAPILTPAPVRSRALQARIDAERQRIAQAKARQQAGSSSSPLSPILR